MKPDEYIKACLRTESHEFRNTPTEEQWRILHAVLGLQDEVGELAKALKAKFFYGKPLDVVNLKEEAGDLCWYLSLLLDASDTTWEEVWEKNIAKLRARYPDKFDSVRALHRDLDAERKALEA